MFGQSKEQLADQVKRQRQENGKAENLEKRHYSNECDPAEEETVKMVNK